MKQKPPKPLIFVIHTSFVSVESLTALFRELAPDVNIRNIVDDSLLPEILANGGVTDEVTRRVCDYYKAAEAAGADMIFNQCSSVGEVADLAANSVRIPVVKVDARMAELACATGRKIGVVATLNTTLGPTCRLIERTAQKMGKSIEITKCLVEGAFDALVGGDRSRHNTMVLGTIRRLIDSVDVVVCAQGSMAAILPELGPTAVPVLTSPKLGVESAVNKLRECRLTFERVAATG